MAPRWPERAPGEIHESPKTAPRALQERPKTAPRPVPVDPQGSRRSRTQSQPTPIVSGWWMGGWAYGDPDTDTACGIREASTIHNEGRKADEALTAIKRDLTTIACGVVAIRVVFA
eukprot:9477311-Pyramimonas_sp.AAC.2